MGQVMKRHKASLYVSLFGTLTVVLSACQASESHKTRSATTQDWCFSGGPIYTAKDVSPEATAIAVKDGVITYAPKDAPEDDWCNTYAGQSARQVALNGAALYPGFTDGHAHLIGIGLRELQLNLDQVQSLAALQEAVRSAAANTPKGETIYGRGWIETHWPEGRFPNRYDLDAVTTDHPVILERADGHAVVTNSLTLTQAGITRTTPSPFGGDIRKMSDGNHAGEPSGLLVDNAQKLITDILPSLTPERRREAYIKASEVYAQRGWTNIHSMSVDPADINLLNQLAHEGEIKIRVYNSIDLLDDGDIMDAMHPEGDVKNALITTDAVKLYADGALGSRGAALLAPYSDDASNVGLMTLTAETMLPILEAALRNGIQINTHAIGDKANREVLGWYKEAFERIPKSERKRAKPRWRIEHSQILDVADIQAFAELGVLPSMQPSHAIGDLHFAVDRLGKERLRGGYAWQSLIDSGTLIIGGSDAPVEVGDPRIEFYAATVRKDLSGYSNDAWYPQEKVTPQDALKMFTVWPAYGAFQENELGTLDVGKAADFTIFATDIMTAAPQDILNAEVVMTIVDGRVAYERP